MKRAIFECWTGLMFCWIGLIFCFTMTYLFGSVLKDSIQMLSKLFIFFVSFTLFFFWSFTQQITITLSQSYLSSYCWFFVYLAFPLLAVILSIFLWSNLSWKWFSRGKQPLLCQGRDRLIKWICLCPGKFKKIILNSWLFSVLHPRDKNVSLVLLPFWDNHVRSGFCHYWLYSTW